MNDKYDWLRPPDRVLETAFTETYEGRIRHRTFIYTYSKTIEVDSLSLIYDISLDTPVSMAAWQGHAARSTFAPRPQLKDLPSHRNSLGVSVSLQTDQADDSPKIGILYRGKVIQPSFEGSLGRDPKPCRDFPDLSCWFTGTLFVFEFDETTRLSGPAALLIRWGDFERTVPLDFRLCLVTRRVCPEKERRPPGRPPGCVPQLRSWEKSRTG